MFFFFNDTATTEIYTLSLHDALPIWRTADDRPVGGGTAVERHELSRQDGDRLVHVGVLARAARRHHRDRKSTRLNSSHANISYAVFCLKKKKKNHSSDIIHVMLHTRL